MEVECEINDVDLEDDNGQPVEGVSATCSRCKHTTKSFGTSERSINRCLVLMREECPENESNFYIDDSEA